MKDTVFFDLDGTLTDPKIGITRSIQYALERLSLEVPAKDELTWCIGPPLLGSFCSLVGDECAGQALHYYRQRFSDMGWKENTLYPGIFETFAKLSDSGRRLHVATSKPFIYARKIIEHFDMRQYFSDVFGSELDGTRADKKDLLRYALAKTQPAANSIMIGDREHDVIGALHNGMRAIGVSYGYGSIEELERAGVHEIVDRPEVLLKIL
jgi:phosphoglycolate phosphatase